MNKEKLIFTLIAIQFFLIFILSMKVFGPHLGFSKSLAHTEENLGSDPVEANLNEVESDSETGVLEKSQQEREQKEIRKHRMKVRAQEERRKLNQ